MRLFCRRESEKLLTHGSLFAGIGGFDLGFERAGIKTVWQVEIDPFCRKVLERHWPNVQRFGDIRECRDLPSVDILGGGFPCQDISIAGDGAGIDEGERSGLWREYLRLIRILRPKFAVVENVAALLIRGMGRVLGDLAEIGYDTEWQVISAADCGSLHLRERVWIVAYPTGQQSYGIFERRIRRNGTSPKACLITDDGAQRVQGEWEEPVQGFPAFSWCKDVRRIEDLRGLTYLPEPLIRRNHNGFSSGMDRLKSLGNAVVPQIAEWIGRRIVEAYEGE